MTTKEDEQTSASRSATVWIGGVHPDWDEGRIRELIAPPRGDAPAKVVGVTIRRKGWRDENGEWLGFALIRLSSEAAARDLIQNQTGKLDLRPHRWAQRRPEEAGDEIVDPLLPLLSGTDVATADHAVCDDEKDFTLEGMPALVEQFEPLTITQIRERLRSFGCGGTAEGEARAQAEGGRLQKKTYLVGLLCRIHGLLPRQFPRRISRTSGMPLPETVLNPLLDELRRTAWPRKKRNVDAREYLVLGVPASGAKAKPLGKHEHLWELSCSALNCASSSSDFIPTSIAVTRDFRGSPHVDAGDRTPQFVLSLGDFEGGGELCIESSPVEVVLVDTRGKLASVDGRFPHWVRDYRGERFSVVFYRVEGRLEPAMKAVGSVVR